MSFLKRIFHLPDMELPPRDMPDDSNISREIQSARKRHISASFGLVRVTKRQIKEAELVKMSINDVLQRIDNVR